MRINLSWKEVVLMKKHLCVIALVVLGAVLFLAPMSFARQSKTCTLSGAFNAREGAALVKSMSRYKSEIRISNGDREINVRSLMNLMSLGLREGSTATVIAEGPDESQAVNAVKNFLENL